MQVVIVGAGNTAHVLGKKAIAAGHSVVQVFGRQLAKAQVLANLLACEAIDQFSQLYLQADIYLLAISDSAISVVADSLPKLGGVVVHTAGAVSLQVSQNVGNRYGVLYPLQSLRKEKPDYETIPLLIDGSNAEVLASIQVFAQSISTTVAFANDADRLKLHTAAVVVSNFTNHLYALAESFCQKEATDFHLLQPLIEEVALRMRQFSPAHMQTGPAIRGDEATIYRHLQVLENYPPLQKLYQLLTQSIQLVNNE